MVRIDPDKVTPLKGEAASKEYLSKPAPTRRTEVLALALVESVPEPRTSSSVSASSTSALYSLATQIIGGVLLTPWFSFPRARHILADARDHQWLAEHVFGLRPPLVFTGNSGDTAFHWIQNAWLLVLAIVITAAWVDAAADAGP